MNEGNYKKEANDINKTPTPIDDAIKNQYNKLSEDWRHFNTILWGIPTIAVTIMAGVVVAAYQPGLVGWPRFVVLAIGSLLLFALTIEVVKKRVHMNAISDILKELQGPNGLELEDDFIFPVGLSSDVEKYLDNKRERYNNELKQHVDKAKLDWLTKSYVDEAKLDWLFRSLRCFLARKYLAYVIFLAAVAVAILAVLDLFGIIIKYIDFKLPFELP